MIGRMSWPKIGLDQGVRCKVAWPGMSGGSGGSCSRDVDSFLGRYHAWPLQKTRARRDHFSSQRPYLSQGRGRLLLIITCLLVASPISDPALTDKKSHAVHWFDDGRSHGLSINLPPSPIYHLDCPHHLDINTDRLLRLLGIACLLFIWSLKVILPLLRSLHLDWPHEFSCLGKT